jgi:hypothetical protein
MYEFTYLLNIDSTYLPNYLLRIVLLGTYLPTYLPTIYVLHIYLQLSIYLPTTYYLLTITFRYYLPITYQARYLLGY